MGPRKNLQLFGIKPVKSKDPLKPYNGEWWTVLHERSVYNFLFPQVAIVVLNRLRTKPIIGIYSFLIHPQGKQFINDSLSGDFP